MEVVRDNSAFRVKSDEEEHNDTISPELRELRRLESHDLQLGYRIGIRLRAIYRPNVEEETRLKVLCDKEWTKRLRVQWEEQNALRGITLQLYQVCRGQNQSGCWVSAEARREPLVALQLKIAKTLEQIAGRHERLIESREVETALSRRLQRGRAGMSLSSSNCTPWGEETCADNIRRWTIASETEELRKRTLVSELLLGSPCTPCLSPGLSASFQPTFSSLEVGGLPQVQKKRSLSTTTPEAKGSWLDSYKEELQRLEMQQQQVEAARSESVIASCCFDATRFELNANHFLEVRCRNTHLQLTERLRYSPSSGELRCGSYKVVLPLKGRKELEESLAGLADGAGLSHNIGQQYEGAEIGEECDSSDEDTVLWRRELSKKKRRKLIKYAVLYKSPAVCESMQVDDSFRVPHSQYMNTGHRYALMQCFTFLDEPLVQNLRVVNREFCALIEGSVSLRRVAYIKTLIRKCGVDFYRLPKGFYSLGVPQTELNKRKMSEASGHTEKRNITFRGLGDDNVMYTLPSSYGVTEDVFMMREPMTVRQWRLVSEHFPHIAHLVTDKDIELLGYNVVPPSDSRNIKLVQKDCMESPSIENCYLELPFETVAKIAAALSGTLPSWQQWEAAVRTTEARPYPWGDDISDVSISLESLPFSWVVDNTNLGKRTDNGYIELGTSMMEVQEVHRAHRLPTSTAASEGREADPEETIRELRRTMTTVQVASHGRKRQSMKQSFRKLSFSKGSFAGKMPRRSSLERLQLPRKSIIVDDDNVQTPGGIRHGVIGHDHEESFTPLTPLPNALQKYEAFPSKLSLRQSSAADLLEGTQSAAAQPAQGSIRRGSRSGTTSMLQLQSSQTFGGVARLGKEWNITDAPIVLQNGTTISGRVVRSLSDLFSIQDVQMHSVSLPSDFLVSNHRCFSGPPAYCMHPEPQLSSRPVREQLLSETVSEQKASVGSEENSGIQVRLKGVGLRRIMCREATSLTAVAAQRCCFRILFFPSGAAQIHPFVK